MNKLKQAAVTAGAALLPLSVFAQGLVPVQQPEGTAGGTDLVGIIRLFINGFLIIVGSVALIFLIIGGVRFIVSSGDEDQAAKAKNTILYAIIGLLVIGISAVVVNFVISTIIGGAAGGVA